MTTATMTSRPMPAPRNGVDTPTLLTTVAAVGNQPELAKFQFRAHSRWINGTHSRATMNGFSGAGGEHTREKSHMADADHPAVLCGEDNGPTPVEYLLSGLAGCLTAGIANIAAVRGVTLDMVEATVEGDADLRGILGLSDEVRNGFSGIRVHFTIRGDAPEEKLREIVMQSQRRSAVYDVLTNGVPVEISVTA
ncbi:MAG: OsmC family protein [Rhodospirillaceae bacterium]